MKRLLMFLSLACTALPLAAQVPFSCSAGAPQPKSVRLEGRTELAGDVVVTCTGGAPTRSGASIPQTTFALVFNAAVTSQVLDFRANGSEILVLLDEPAAGAQYPCLTGTCNSVGNGTGIGYYGPPSAATFSGNPNVFQATVATGNTVTATLPVDPPGQTRTRVFRFTNIRMDAAAAPGGILRLTGITAGQVPVSLATGGVTLATAQAGLAASVRDAANSVAAPNGVSLALAPGGANATRSATVRFSSGAARARTVAFTTNLDAPPPPAAQNVPGQAYNSETGFYNPAFGTTSSGSNLALAGLADWGTRLMATFSNIPSNVTVYVSLRNDGATAINAPAARLTLTDGNGEGGFSAIAGNGTYAQLTPSSGSAMAVWEVTRGSGAAFNWDFGVYFSYPGGITAAPAPIGVKLTFAPRSGGAPIFVDAGALTLATFTTAPLFSVTPTSLTFTGTAGGQNPPAQQLTIMSTAPAAYTLAGGGTLQLFLTPTAGNAPGTATVAVDIRNLAAGTYRDVITLSGAQAPLTIPVTLTIAAGPAITSLNPPATTAGAPTFTLTVSGANFTTGTTVRWNGSPLTTTFVGPTQLTAQVSAALVANTGQASVTAVTPDGAVSNAVAFTVSSFTLTQISPATAVAGGPAFTLTATGTGFQNGAVLRVGSATVQPTSVTATTLTATVPASAIAQAGALSVTVTNPTGLVSNALTLTVTEALTLTRISPETVTATGPAFALTLTGTGFATGATVDLGASTLTPTSVSRTQIAVNVPATAIAEPGPLSVRVTNPDKQTSNALTLTVNPAPRITALSPSSAAVGGAAFTLTVTGTNLSNGSTVRWNSQNLSTTFVSGTQLTAPVSAALIASAGTASVSVTSADGVASNTLTFTIQGALSITSLSPATANVGSGAFTLTVNGANIPQGSTVVWAGQRLTTTFVSVAQLTAQVPAGLIAAAGTAQITVATAGGANSNALPFLIVLPPLTNVGFTAPATASSGQDQPITLTFGGAYPVDLRGTLTLTFAPDSGLPNDPTIQFQNGSRTLTFNVTAGAAPQPPAVVAKTGTVAGVITIAAAFATATGENVTPAGLGPQRIQISRAAPGISSVSCTRNAAGFTMVIDGFTNTREAGQATFDFAAASGASLGTTQLTVPAGPLFSGWFGSSAAATAGGVFRYTQPFNVQGTSSSVAGVSVRLTNSTGTSASASCQLQ